VLAKVDLEAHPARQQSPDALRISSRSMVGIGELEARLRSLAQQRPMGLSGRQRRELTLAATALDEIGALADDLAAERLADVDAILAGLVGEIPSAVDALEIYSQFCIGK
jgi:tRNA U34 5-carboxymethylaminomethyl modifying GTPase MnmE/TrmE